MRGRDNVNVTKRLRVAGGEVVALRGVEREREGEGKGRWSLRKMASTCFFWLFFVVFCCMMTLLGHAPMLLVDFGRVTGGVVDAEQIKPPERLVSSPLC